MEGLHAAACMSVDAEPSHSKASGRCKGGARDGGGGGSSGVGREGLRTLCVHTLFCSSEFLLPNNDIVRSSSY